MTFFVSPRRTVKNCFLSTNSNYLLIILILIVGLFGKIDSAKAQFTHERIRRITVFPIKIEVEDARELGKQVEEAWWDLREKLTESKRFVVASRNFMQAKDVYQPRGELQPADAIILGRLLDANALLTFFLKERRLSLRAYETKNGLTLWSGDVEMHPAVPLSKQIGTAAQKLTIDFVTSIPYQGFVMTDNLIGRALYSEGDRKLFKADVGLGTQISVGDTVQLVEVLATQLKPIFQEGGAISAYGEGRVTHVDRQVITVQLIRLQDHRDIADNALIRVPDELRRLREAYGISEDSEKNIDYHAITKVSHTEQARQKEIKPLVAALSWVGNLIAILLLAF